MREIFKVVDKTVDGKTMQFRLKKLDAFSGAGLLRMIAGEQEGKMDLLDFFVRLPDTALRHLMSICLEHVEVMLPAGWNPVMTRGEWSWQEAEHDTLLCLKLTLEEALWTLQGFFGGSDSKPPGAEAGQ
jgi:hypothetical protein